GEAEGSGGGAVATTIVTFREPQVPDAGICDSTLPAESAFSLCPTSTVNALSFCLAALSSSPITPGTGVPCWATTRATLLPGATCLPLAGLLPSTCPSGFPEHSVPT